MDELLDDVFQGDQPHRFVEGIALALAVDALDEGHVTLVTFFELFEDDVQRGVFEDEVARVLVELAQRLQRRSVLGVHQRQLFDEQQRYDVRTLPVVHRNTRKT